MTKPLTFRNSKAKNTTLIYNLRQKAVKSTDC